MRENHATFLTAVFMVILTLVICQKKKKVTKVKVRSIEIAQKIREKRNFLTHGEIGSQNATTRAR